MAILSGLLHAGAGATIEGVAAAFTGAMALEDDRATLYGDLVLRAAGAIAEQVLEVLMTMPEGYEPQSDFARKHWSRGREEGREEGRVSAMCEAVIKVVTSRGLLLSDTERAAILRTTELSILERWLIDAVSATSVEELLHGAPSTPEG